MDKTRKFLRTLSIQNEPIIVGCSGGPDSMCLLRVLYDEGYKVICAHVDHSIREESVDERIFVEEHCRNLGIIFEPLKLEKRSENEFYYRKKRYDFYKKLADKYDTPYIATAHHGDDLIETVLMRLSRGSNLKGYTGFKKVHKEKKYVFIKPLIFYTKSEILNFAAQHNVDYVIDKTNDEDNYTRNRYRHHVLPFLKKENSNVHSKYLQFSEELSTTSEFIDELVDQAIQSNFDGAIKLNKFEMLHPFLQKKELEKILSNIYEDDVDKVQSFHIENILNCLKAGKNFKINLPLGIEVSREYDSLKFKKHQSTEPYKILLTKHTSLQDSSSIDILDYEEDTSNYTTRISSEDVALPLYVRTRYDGDKMEIKNMKGSKKIKDIFIDEKIEPSKRFTYPIVVDSDDVIVWLPGLRKSKFDINKDGKYDIILKYTKREENTDEKK